MDKSLRWAGAGMMIASVLFFTRMAPIFAVLPDDMAFPPSTGGDLARLAEIAGWRWPLSHAMGLVAICLFATGYWAHAKALTGAGRRAGAHLAAIIASFAFGLFAVALIVDGFVLPAAVPSGEARVGAVHRVALSFFTPGVFAMFIAMGVLASRLLHGFIHSRWLGAIGMVIAIAGPTAYLFGVAGPNWDNLQIGGSLMMLAFFWHFIVGAVALFGRGARRPA